MGLKYKTEEISVEDSNAFFEGYATGANLDTKSPILALREKLMRHKTGKVDWKLTQSEQVKLFIVAWNKFRKGENVKLLKLPEPGEEIKLQ